MTPSRSPPARARRAAAFASVVATAGLAACAGPPSPTSSKLSVPPGRYKLGAPYRVGGVRYAPADQPDYVAVGAASWYGRAYQGRLTADGERFDAAALTGAHPTLPLPSWVEVENLENGRSLRVRVNDRGAFRPGRVIDLSRAAAERLGFAAQGVARVRVRYLGPAPPDARADRSGRGFAAGS